ncbi:MAG TPA: response regulator [Oscillatoriales cyanobacterium M59_W2019_021]|nr:response regulator [Oscillatoriales cyanobacterium M4454_W2019_049]HIK52177.1 response regulator [Oscillatoriales cyanobacterium M59_W2019_021]
MLPEQQRILGYFIEEAGDHLNTIEQGLLNLQGTIEDPEMVNEVFRAAHSVKGGAAMLGLSSIQQIAHRLEDSFKVLKEQPVRVDQQLESLFLTVFDALQELLEQLQTQGSLSKSVAAQTLAGVEPVFDQLDRHLDSLVKAQASGREAPRMRPVTPPPLTVPPTTAWDEDEDSSALQLIFQSDAIARLREMLKLFKQPDTPETREQLREICRLLGSAGEQFDLTHWTELLQAADRAIANPNNTFSTLASVLIKEIKQGQELVLAHRAEEIAIDAKLQALLPVEVEPIELENDFDDLLGAAEASHPRLDEVGQEDAEEALELQPIDLQPESHPRSSSSRGPEVGMAELNTLADLFEGETPDLESWDAAGEILNGMGELSLNASGDGSTDSDFSEFMLDDEEASRPRSVTPSREDDSIDLFGFDFDGEEAQMPPEDAQPEATAIEPIDDLFADFADDLFGDRSELGTEETDAAAPATDKEWGGLWDDAEPITHSQADLTPSSPDRSPEEDLSLDDLFGATMGETDASAMPDLDLPGFEDGAAATDDFSLDDLFRESDAPAETAASEAGEEEDAWDLFADFEGVATAAEDDHTDTDAALEDLFEMAGTMEDASSETASGPEADLSALFGLEPEAPEIATEPSLPDVPAPATNDDWDDLFAMIEVENGNGDRQPAMLEMPANDLQELEALLATPSPEAAPPPPEPAIEPEADTPTELISLEILLNLDPRFANGSVFSALETYLEQASPKVAIADRPASASKSDPGKKDELSKSDFDDLERLLEETENSGSTLASSAAASRGKSRAPSRRRGGSFEQTMRVPIKQLDTLSNLVGELVVSRNSLEQDQERLRQFLDNLLHQVQQLGDVGQRMQDLYERTLLEMALLSSRQHRSRPTTDQHDRGGDFEALEMDRFTEFHTQAQEIIELIVRVRESASDIDFLVTENDQVTRQLRQTTNQLQGGLTQARMVPFSQIADRLPRGIRDNAIKYGKQIELNVEGRETPIDKMILEHLYDPMTHLVNNAVAHGIETPEERVQKGKPPAGRISISTFHQGNQTIISVADNGAGIDAECVKQKALHKGLISPQQAQKMSDMEVYDLLFLPGFSTKDKADDLAGRGVGLDVVKTKIHEIRGTITIDSTLGKGTTFTIRLPLTLSISKALCCACDRATIAFPMDGVADVLNTFSPQHLITDEKGQQYLPWRDQNVPFQRLSELYKYNRTQRGYGGPATDDETISVVVLRSAGTYLAVQVDRAISEQEIVIKQLSGPIPKPIGIAGATVMGDGRIVPIADVLELIELSLGRVRRETSTLWDSGAAETPVMPEKQEQTVLIIDDSITVRELLSMTFKKAGYRVEQARDGQEAWDKLRAGVPCDLVFCDMEMPRMNGMELLSRMHKDSHLSQLPIAMLTSRTAERHKKMAIDLGARGYFTKPYLEEVLLDAAQRLLRGEVLVTAKAEAEA